MLIYWGQRVGGDLDFSKCNVCLKTHLLVMIGQKRASFGDQHYNFF